MANVKLAETTPLVENKNVEIFIYGYVYMEIVELTSRIALRIQKKVFSPQLLPIIKSRLTLGDGMLKEDTLILPG